MARFRKLIREIHRRSLWQVLFIYMGTCWMVLQVVDHVVAQFALPEWIYGAAVVLLLIGLPIVLSTAFVQEGGPESYTALLDTLRLGTGGRRRAAPEAEARGPGGRAVEAGDRAGEPGGLFTWPNAVLGGLLAFALWGLVATALLLARTWSGGPGAAGAGAAGADAAGPTPTRGTVAVAAADTPTASGPGSREATETSGADLSDGEAAAERGAPGQEAPTRGAAEDATTPTANAGARRQAEGAGLQGYLDAVDRVRPVRAAARDPALADVAAPLLASADSLWSAASDAAGASRYQEAETLARLAGLAYENALQQARAVWHRRLDSARDRLAELEGRADASADLSDAAAGHEQRARRLEEEGRFREALTALADAADAYRRAAEEAAGADTAKAAQAGPADAGAGEAGRREGPSPAVAREIVKARLFDLQRALEAEDLEALRRVWVTLPEEEARDFARFFEDHRDLRVSYDVLWETLEAGPERIAVTVRARWEYARERDGRRQRQQPFEQRLEVEPREGSWVLVDY